MDQSCHSYGDSSASATTTTTTTTTTSNNNTDQYLRHLNKISHKISKPTTTIRPPPPPPPPVDHPHQNIHQPPPPQQQNQPPVYNIKKSDFRDVVQKLTGSPAHDRCFSPSSSSAAAPPPPIQPPKPPSSRLQRIRPPPLPQITNLPPPLMNTSAPASTNQRQAAPFSPLPPFPSVHAAAESPISAYMRYLHSTAETEPKRDYPLVTQPQPPPSPPMSSASMAQSPFVFPSSPLPFGCSLSPGSPHPLLFSPSTAGQLGFQNFPVSPRLPVPEP